LDELRDYLASEVIDQDGRPSNVASPWEVLSCEFGPGREYLAFEFRQGAMHLRVIARAKGIASKKKVATTDRRGSNAGKMSYTALSIANSLEEYIFSQSPEYMQIPLIW